MARGTGGTDQCLSARLEALQSSPSIGSDPHFRSSSGVELRVKVFTVLTLFSAISPPELQRFRETWPQMRNSFHSFRHCVGLCFQRSKYRLSSRGSRPLIAASEFAVLPSRIPTCYHDIELKSGALAPRLGRGGEPQQSEDFQSKNSIIRISDAAPGTPRSGATLAAKGFALVGMRRFLRVDSQPRRASQPRW